jgi:hypothetical protein
MADPTMSQADAQKAVQDLHDQVSPQDLKPVLEEHYTNMDPAQMQQIIAQLQAELAAKDHPQTQQAVAAVDPAAVTPQQAAELHAHAHEFHPDTVQKVLIAGAGAAAVGGLALLAAKRLRQG